MIDRVLQASNNAIYFRQKSLSKESDAHGSGIWKNE
jgi:hypothetical protein